MTKTQTIKHKIVMAVEINTGGVDKREEEICDDKTETLLDTSEAVVKVKTLPVKEFAKVIKKGRFVDKFEGFFYW